MGRLIEDIPVFAARCDVVPARHYNLWRRARMRLGTPIAIGLPELKEMELILEHDAWVVIDHNRHQVPVLAWTAFSPPPERGLHEPVPCTLNYYHFMASSLRAPVLDYLFTGLEKRLRRGAR